MSQSKSVEPLTKYAQFNLKSLFTQKSYCMERRPSQLPQPAVFFHLHPSSIVPIQSEYKPFCRINYEHPRNSFLFVQKPLLELLRLLCVIKVSSKSNTTSKKSKIFFTPFNKLHRQHLLLLMRNLMMDTMKVAF